MDGKHSLRRGESTLRLMIRTVKRGSPGALKLPFSTNSETGDDAQTGALSTFLNDRIA